MTKIKGSNKRTAQEDTMDTELNKEELSQEDLEKAAGGTFDRNYYSQSEYEAVGITVVTHWIERDEFWWKGVNIGEKGANSVVFFTAVKGRAPSSLEESMPFWEANHKKKFERHRH